MFFDARYCVPEEGEKIVLYYIDDTFSVGYRIYTGEYYDISNGDIVGPEAVKGWAFLLKE